MLLYYHKDPRGNFGDDLNPWLWSRLLPGCFTGELSHDPRCRDVSAGGETLFVGIGTLLNENVPGHARKVVFGSGAGYGPPPVLDSSWDFFCVRGPATAALLGLDKAAAITDPGVLVRTIELPHSSPIHRLAFMPHCASARRADWSTICESIGIGFIDPQWPVDDVLRAIRSTEVLITEAMHGAIVADALRVPWIAVATGSTLNFKWNDWCQSMSLAYRPLTIPTVRQGPGAGTAAKVRSIIKTTAARIMLQRIVRRGIPSLSSDTRMNAATEELQERLETLRRRYGCR
jgi:succinoglycan biosynthesis protein ExoV